MVHFYKFIKKVKKLERNLNCCRAHQKFITNSWGSSYICYVPPECKMNRRHIYRDVFSREACLFPEPLERPLLLWLVDFYILIVSSLTEDIPIDRFLLKLGVAPAAVWLHDSFHFLWITCWKLYRCNGGYKNLNRYISATISLFYFFMYLSGILSISGDTFPLKIWSKQPQKRDKNINKIRKFVDW